MLTVISILLFVHHIQARPIPTIHLDQCTSSSGDTRTIWNIVWSSLVTLFACIWVAVHPNVPAPTDGTIALVKQRAKLLLTAVIAPEFIVMFAMRQWVCARQVTLSEFGRERGWTQAHGFFMAMGGFMLYDSDGERVLYPLDLESVEKLIRTGAIDFPKVSEKEILDKSKGDLISKGLAIVQTGWFIMQCIARGAEHLAITELEIMTVGFAFLNLVTYLFWWNKPLKVSCPVQIVLKKGQTAPERRPTSRDISFGDRIGRMVTLIDPDRDRDVDLIEEKRVPTFYGGRISRSSKSFHALYIVEMVVAMIFGGIHCVAWSFSFPTRVEQTLWHACSITIISIPFLFLVFLAITDFYSLIMYPYIAIYLSSILLYPVARLVLLVLSFTSLRSLPPTALHTVRWTTFIPHV